MAHALAPIMRRLVDTLQGALPETDVRQLHELIDASQLQLALEWITDSVTQRSMTRDPQLRQLLVQLGTQLGIVQSIRDRLQASGD